MDDTSQAGHKRHRKHEPARMPNVHQSNAKLIALICKPIKLPRIWRKPFKPIKLPRSCTQALAWPSGQCPSERSSSSARTQSLATLHQCRHGRVPALWSNFASIRASRAERKHAYDSVLTPCCVRPRDSAVLQETRNTTLTGKLSLRQHRTHFSDMICRLARITADRQEALKRLTCSQTVDLF